MTTLWFQTKQQGTKKIIKMATKIIDSKTPTISINFHESYCRHGVQIFDIFW